MNGFIRTFFRTLAVFSFWRGSRLARRAKIWEARGIKFKWKADRK